MPKVMRVARMDRCMLCSGSVKDDRVAAVTSNSAGLPTLEPVTVEDAIPIIDSSSAMMNVRRQWPETLTDPCPPVGAQRRGARFKASIKVGRLTAKLRHTAAWLRPRPAHESARPEPPEPGGSSGGCGRAVWGSLGPKFPTGPGLGGRLALACQSLSRIEPTRSCP